MNEMNTPQERGAKGQKCQSSREQEFTYEEEPMPTGYLLSCRWLRRWEKVLGFMAGFTVGPVLAQPVLRGDTMMLLVGVVMLVLFGIQYLGLRFLRDEITLLRCNASMKVSKLMNMIVQGVKKLTQHCGAGLVKFAPVVTVVGAIYTLAVFVGLSYLYGIGMFGAVIMIVLVSFVITLYAGVAQLAAWCWLAMGDEF